MEKNDYYTEKISPKKGRGKAGGISEKPPFSAAGIINSGDENVPKAEIIGVRFKDAGKVYYFSPGGITFSRGDKVIVETVRGVECGDIILPNSKIPEKSLTAPLKKVVRKANEADVLQAENNREREREIMWGRR